MPFELPETTYDRHYQGGGSPFPTREERIVLLTGYRLSGKSVYLAWVCLITSIIPHAESHLFEFDAVHDFDDSTNWDAPPPEFRMASIYGGEDEPDWYCFSFREGDYNWDEAIAWADEWHADALKRERRSAQQPPAY